MEGCASATASGTAELSVVTYPQTLLSSAEELLQRGQLGISVVVSHMACEVAAERTISEGFRVKGIEFLGESVLAYLNGYNLASERNRRLYSALTGDEIQQSPFWASFKASAARRNEVMHKSRIVTRVEAEESLEAAKALVAHLGR